MYSSITSECLQNLLYVTKFFSSKIINGDSETYQEMISMKYTLHNSNYPANITSASPGRKEKGQGGKSKPGHIGNLINYFFFLPPQIKHDFVKRRMN